MSKTFDKVWHEGLLFKLKQNGISKVFYCFVFYCHLFITYVLFTYSCQLLCHYVISLIYILYIFLRTISLINLLYAFRFIYLFIIYIIRSRHDKISKFADLKNRLRKNSLRDAIASAKN